MQGRVQVKRVSRRAALIGLGLAASLAAVAQTPQLHPDWHFFRGNEERTGTNRTPNGSLAAVQRSGTQSPAIRWIFPHNMPEAASALNPIPYNVGGGVGSPVAGPVNNDLMVFYGTFQTVTRPPSAGVSGGTATAGVVWGMSGFEGAGADGYRPAWWYGYRNVPTDLSIDNPTASTWTQRENQFLQQVSERIVEGYADPAVLRTSQPMGAVRSTPGFAHLDAPLAYTTKVVSLDGTANSLQKTTQDIVVVGADDGFVYCLDADPRNAITYEQPDTDATRPNHRTVVAPLIWRYDTVGLVGASANPQVIQVASSPVIAKVGSDTTPSIFVGTGVGYMIRLDLKGKLIWSLKTAPIVKTDTFESPIGYPITSSPAFFSDRLYYAAADSVVYCVNAATGQEVWTYVTGEGKDSPKARTGLFTPPVVGTVAFAEGVGGKNLVYVAAGGVPDTDNPGIGRSTPAGQMAGAVYALDASNGKVVWTFDRYKNPLAEDPEKEVFIGAFTSSPAYGEFPIRSVSANTKGVAVRSNDGNLYLVDAEKGTMLWDVPTNLQGEDLNASEQFLGSPAVTREGYIYIAGRDGTVRGIFPGATAALRKETGEEDFTIRAVGEEVWREQTGVLVNQPPTGRETAPTQTLQPTPVFSTPAITRGMLFVAGNGHLFAYQDTNGSGQWGGPGYAYRPFDPRNPNATRPSQTQTPGSTRSAEDRIHVDIFSHETYTSGVLPVGIDHGGSLGVKGSPAWTFAHPGRVEWGDSIYVIAWNLDERVSTVMLRLQGPNGTIQVTVPVFPRKDVTGGTVGKQGVARYAFVLDPVSPRIVDPRNHSLSIVNPFYGLPLTPGGNGTPTWTVSAVQNAATSTGQTDRNTSNASSEQDVRSRFRVNNPLDLELPGVSSLKEPENQANGRNPSEGLGSVPLLPFSLGDHGTQSVPVRFIVKDRSHLSTVKRANEAGTLETPEGTLPPGAPKPLLTVKIAPAEYQWLGGTFAVYKPMFAQYEDGSPAWLAPVTVPPTLGLEGIPATIGQPNASLDYPNIRSDQAVFRRTRDGTDAVRRDSAIGEENSARREPFDFAVNIPRYQPANGDPDFPLGPGYATVNPLNRFTRDVLAGNPVYHPVYPQDNAYLTRVYVDSSRNGSHDPNEAYRTFVSGVRVRVDESFQVVEQTVDLPGPWPGNIGPTPPGVPHGYVPFTDYWGTKVPNGQGLLQAESPFYRPFTLVNTGNVNLWNVKVEKSPRYVSPLFSGTVDPNFVTDANLRSQTFTGAIQPGNIMSTLDVPPGVSPQDARFWTPIRKPRVGSVAPNRILMRDPIRQVETGLPEITVAVPVGTPVGKYTTQPVFFEDGLFKGPSRDSVKLLGANGVYDERLRTPSGAVRTEAWAPKKLQVAVEVMESRLTSYPPVPAVQAGQASSIQPFLLRNVDPTATLGISNADPTAYRSADGSMHLLFTSTRAVEGTQPQATPAWFLTGSDLLFNRSIDPAQDNPWGWTYGNTGAGFFLPQDTSKWWKDPIGPFPDPRTAPGMTVFSAPSVVSDGQNAWLFYQGYGTFFDPSGGGAQWRSRLLYTRLNGSEPVGNVMAVPGDETSPREFPKPFTYVDTNRVPRVGVMWQGGAPGPVGLFVSTTANPADPSSWTPPQRLSVPVSLSSAMQPSPAYKPSADPRVSIVEVVFSGVNKADQNSDLFLARYDTATWQPMPLPRIFEERMLRMPGKPVYTALGIDWQLQEDLLPVIRWVNPDGTDKRHYSTGQVLKAELQQMDEPNRRLVYRDTTGTYTITVDAAAGTVSFGANDPRAPLPGDQDRVLVSYSPRAWRLTTDPRSDTQPIFFVDRSQEWVNGKLTPWRVPTAVGGDKPFQMERARLWVIWRRGNAGVGGGTGGAGGVGTLGSTTLFYKTYRLAIALPTPITVNANTGAPNVSVQGAAGKWTVDPQSGRLFFSEVDEGRTVQVTYNGSATLAAPVGWLAETANPANREIAVPIKVPVNEGQVWAFKDPFSFSENLPPDSPAYLSMTNNNVWLFWSSTRGGVGDLYYMTLSPRL